MRTKSLVCKILVASALLSCGTSIAAAADEPQWMQVSGIGRVPYQRLFEATSVPGETLDDFALRISPKLREYSDETGFEACGVLASDGERFGVIVGTNRAHIACVNRSSFVPDGMSPTGETIHSHGIDSSFQVNRSDKLLLGLSGSSMVTLNGQKLDAFSPLDYHGGPGYLATPDGVIHQKGDAGSVRIIENTSK